MKSNKFNVGDIVYTDTHAVHQTTQKSLSRLKGKVINNDDDMDIHVRIDGVDGPIGFSEFELYHKRPTVYKNEKL